MKERPILFSAPMVRAILDGRKTQTRRVMKVQPPDDRYEMATCASTTGNRRDVGKHHWVLRAGNSLTDSSQPYFSSPYGYNGDRLWVRETWQGPLVDDADALRENLSYYSSPAFCEYAADGGPAPEFVTCDDELVRRWSPSIHMPRWASRITLEITGVRVERLQEITNSDAKAEGPENARPHRHGAEGMDFEVFPGTIIKDRYAHRHNTGINDCWICAYRQIWQTINGPGSWDANPWVWVIEFKRP